MGHLQNTIVAPDNTKHCNEPSPLKLNPHQREESRKHFTNTKYSIDSLITSELEKGNTPEKQIPLKDGKELMLFRGKEGEVTAWIKDGDTFKKVEDFKLASAVLDGGSMNYSGTLPKGVTINGSDKLNIFICNRKSSSFDGLINRSRSSEPDPLYAGDVKVNNEVIKDNSIGKYQVEHGKAKDEMVISYKTPRSGIEYALASCKKSPTGKWEYTSLIEKI